MIRSATLVALACLTALANPTAGEATAPAHPPKGGSPEERAPSNLILITLDTTRADRLGCYGAANARTPALDGLAAAGVLFENAVSPTPLTLPSHASLLTGQPPRLHGVRDNGLFRLMPEAETLAERLAAAGYATAAVVGAAVLDRSTGIGQGFSTYDDEVRVGPRRWFNWEERAAGMVTDAALERVGLMRQPFFLWVHYYDPHKPYVAPDPFGTELGQRAYEAEIAYMDAEIGRLLDAVASLERGGAGPMVAVAGDHGESLGEHGETTHGVFVYQATQHVPLILAGPGLPAGRRIGGTVGLVDVAPTLLDLLGLPPLDGAVGRSLRPLIDGRGRSGGRTYELESHYPVFAFGWAPVRALLDGALKYVDLPRQELYDLEADPGERKNLAEERPAKARAMKRALLQVLGPDAGVPAIQPADSRDVAAQLDRLRALGYVSGAMGAVHDQGQTASAPGQADPLPLSDPKDLIDLLDKLDRARELVSAGTPKEAVPLLDEILERSPAHVQALMVLGNAHLAAGDVVEAVRVHRRAVERSPASHLTHFNLGNALRAAGGDNLRSAESAFRDALARHPRHADSYRALALLLAAQRDLEGARRVVRGAESQGVSDPDLLLIAGNLEASLGDLDEAERLFAAARRADRDLPGIHQALGRIAYMRGDPRKAAKHYREALALDPTAAAARTLGSILLNDLGDVDGARDAFTLALSLAPDGPDAPLVREMLRVLEGREPEVEISPEPAP